jgi:hypothetical protein
MMYQPVLALAVEISHIRMEQLSYHAAQTASAPMAAAIAEGFAVERSAAIVPAEFWGDYPETNRK